MLPASLAVALLLVVFLLLLLLPFVPGVAEVFRPQDQYPLPVNTDYVKEPRYLGRSAWSIVRQALGPRRSVDGRHEVAMSKDELVEVSGARTLEPKTAVEDVLYVRGNLSAGAGVTSERDLFVEGHARIDGDCRLRAVACAGDVIARDGIFVTRWIDAGGLLTAGDGSDLGTSAVASGKLRLGSGVRFHRLCGSPIETGDVQRIPTPATTARPARPEDPIETIEDAADYHNGDHRIDDDGTSERPLVVKGDLAIGARAVLHAPARVYGTTTIAEGASIHGDLFCEGPVEVGANVRIYGNLFCQAGVVLGTGVRVARVDAPKSVIARDGLRLEHNVRIFGYVLAEGEATTA